MNDLTLQKARAYEAEHGAAISPAERPAYHMTPYVGWLNDPNGFSYYKGKYHQFYQYNPYDVRWAPMHWGHAVSTDLLHWEQLPVMLYPDEPFDCHGAYSGSALVEDGTMYLYYTGNVKHPGNFDYIKEGRGHNVCLAVSKDGATLDSKQCLLTNRDYPAGLTCHVRDPKVFAYEGRYYMVLGARTLEDKGEVLVLESTDKLRWTHINTLTTPEPFGYMWECPDLFCLDGQWYLAVSPQGIDCQNVYGCGWFAIHGDWRGDCTLSEFHELDAGFDYYAPQSFVDGNGCRIQIGWMGMPDEPTYGNAPTVACGWQHCLTVPCELTQRGGRLHRYPVKELEQLREKPVSPENAHIFDMELRIFCPGRLVIRGAAVVEWSDDEVILSLGAVSGAGRTVRYARTQAQTMRILADASSLEIFINHGETVLTTRYYPDPAARGVVLDGGTAQLWSINRMEIMDGISR